MDFIKNFSGTNELKRMFRSRRTRVDWGVDASGIQKSGKANFYKE